MKYTLGDHYFARESAHLAGEVERLKKFEQVNAFLKGHNWLFVTPVFFQGYELEFFFDLSQQPSDHTAAINRIIFRKFFNLPYAASFIDGYCKRCSHIEPFLASIEHSLVLAFQRDYEGGIKTLIPIIEGVLRKYLVIDRGRANQQIKFQELRKSLLQIKEDMLAGYVSAYQSPTTDPNGQRIVYSSDQISELMRLETQYLDTWFSFITDFIDHSLYLNTTDPGFRNQLNRHAVLHEYGLNIPYSLENYIKIYFVIQFLTWIFLKKEGKSPLNEIDDGRFRQKILAYEIILRESERLIRQKDILYQAYAGYDSSHLHQCFDVTTGLAKADLKPGSAKNVILRAVVWWMRRKGVQPPKKLHNFK